MLNSTTLIDFIRQKYNNAPGHLALWSKKTKRTLYYSVAEYEELVRDIMVRQEHEDLYIALGTQAERLPPEKRGSVETVVFLPGFVADIDSGEDKQSKKCYPPSKFAATKILETFDLKPTSIIDTGNGLHVHWDLIEGLILSTKEDNQKAQALWKAFQRKVIAHFKQHGYDVDSVGDLTRNYRLPDTFNLKEAVAKPVGLVFHDPQQRYSLNQIEVLVKAYEDAPDIEESDTKKVYATANHDNIVQECSWYRDCTQSAAACDEPNWYAAASITACCKKGKEIFHEYSSTHPGYNEKEASAKFARAKKEAGPRTCRGIRYDLGQEQHCSTCPQWEKITSPVQLGKARYDNDYDPGTIGPLPLGFTKEGLYALRDQIRNIIILASANQLISYQYLLGLASSNFWGEQFPLAKKLFNFTGAGEALIHACKMAGPFHPIKVRGRGIWLEGNREIINLGAPIPAETKYTYLCFEPIPIQQQQHFDVQRLLKFLKMFNWRNPQDAMLLLGWIAIAPICGVLQWRPHCFVYGPPRCGKTTIHTMIAQLVSPLAVSTDGQSSEAGIRQMLGPDSLAVIIDEFESDQNNQRLRSIIKLARSASSAETPVLRGTPEGRAMQFSLRTTFFFSAINPSGMSPADESRILLLELLMHENDEFVGRQLVEEETYFAERESEWCGYMVTHAGKINPAIQIFSQAMPGLDSRHRKNVSTLLAGAFVALHERLPSAEEARTWMAEFTATIQLHAASLERDDAVECLHYLFSHVVEKYPLGHWVGREYEVCNSKGPVNRSRDSLRIVTTFDMKITVDGDEAGLLILNGSPSINKLFANTRWGNNAWEKALRKMNGAFFPKIPPYFPSKKGKSRCIGIPLEMIPEPMVMHDIDGN